MNNFRCSKIILWLLRSWSHIAYVKYRMYIKIVHCFQHFCAFSKKKHKKAIRKYIYFYIYIIISLFWLKQDIRWCKIISGKFKVMSLQDRSQTVITSRSKDGCRVVQKSAIFYHVSQNDTLLDIMCESGYPDYGYECGERGINLKFRIPITLIERGKKYFTFSVIC